MENVIWKDIERFNGKYAVSNTGLIRNNETEKTLKTRIGKSGYECVVVRPNGRYGKCYCLKIHRELCLLFLDNPDNKPHVNHKDGIKTNNSLGNLEWVTKRENVQHAYATGLMISQKGTEKTNSKVTEEDVVFILSSSEKHHVLAKRFNIARQTISKIKSGKKWGHVKI